MAFRTILNDNNNFSTPQEMFQDNKMKRIIGLIDYQSKTIDNYMNTIQTDGSIDEKYVAFELPTGSGKTLIGLLIGEFHRRKYDRRVLFLCPTNQLVKQVCKQAKDQYGISTIAFCGKQSSYLPSDKTDFFLHKKIGVTTYSSFFATSEYFKGTDILIFDDAHSSEQYISDNWSLNISRQENNVLYSELTELIKDTPIGESFYSHMTDDSTHISDVGDWCNMIPYPFIADKVSDLRQIISANVDNTDLSYPWSRIQDNLEECNIFVSWDSILIRPYISPTLSFDPFKNAKQCVFMSATLGKSGELERSIGVLKIKQLPIVGEWDKKGIGRKFFLFPDLSFESNVHYEIIEKLHSLTNRSVIIVPSIKEQNELENLIRLNLPNTVFYDAKSLSASKDEFNRENNVMAIIANRFDGIDFPDDESRILVLYNLHKITHLQEKFFYSKMAASVLFSERIKMRIVQAVGRCTRNARDYAIVCVLGDSILNDFIINENIQEYKPEMRAEIQFGIENSINLQNLSDMIQNANLFLSRDSTWADAEDNIVKFRDKYISDGEKLQDKEIYQKLHKAAEKEVKLQYCLWKKDYQSAFDIIGKIIEMLNAPRLRGYKSFWQYYQGVIGERLGPEYTTKVQQLYESAAKSVLGINWFTLLANKFKSKTANSVRNNYFDAIVEDFEKQMSLYKTAYKLESKIKTIINGLKNSKGETFETYHTNLGTLLGYVAVNSKETGAPDPYWIINDDICIVFEDKVYENEDKEIPIKHISQAKHHPVWIKEKEPHLKKKAKIYTVFLTNSKKVEESAKIYASGLYYCKINSFTDWAVKALTTVRKCYNVFTGEGNSEWRIFAKQQFEKNNVTPRDFIDLMTSNKLTSL